METSELTGAALDWAVAKCEGLDVAVHSGVCHDAELIEMGVDGGTRLTYSTNWAQGGPIIEREKLSVGTRYTSDQIYHDADVLCWARTAIGGFLKYGQTPLIAAMRCYVASKLGDEVNVPEELK